MGKVSLKCVCANIGEKCHVVASVSNQR